MGDTVNNEQVSKRSFVQGLKAEYNKIIWPDKETVRKQTIAVVLSTAALGLMIGILDFIIKYLLNFILK